MAESSNVSSQESFANSRSNDRTEHDEHQQNQKQRQFQQYQQNANERDHRPTEIPASKVSVK